MSAFRTDERSLFIWAAHEAGHAVSGLVGAMRIGLGNPIVLVRLDKTGKGYVTSSTGTVIPNCRAICDFSKDWMDALKCYDATASEYRRVIVHAEAHLDALFAGPYAELVASGGNGSVVHFGNFNDFYQAEKLSAWLAQFPGAGGRRPWMRIHQDARAFVIEHWPVIASIATRILKEGELSGPTVGEMFEAFCQLNKQVNVAA